MSDHTNSWSNTTPAETDKVGIGDDAIKQVKLDMSERMGVDHIFNNTSVDGAGQDGVHSKLTLKNDNTVSAGVSDAGIIHVKDDSGKAELFYMKENDVDCQLTSAGTLHVDDSQLLLVTGTAVLISGTPSYNAVYGFTYPSGYTINNCYCLSYARYITSVSYWYWSTSASLYPGGFAVATALGESYKAWIYKV